MFTSAEREALRVALIEEAETDAEVVGAALVGSAATDREDAWSDIDLVLQVAGDADPSDVAMRWTDTLYAHGAAQHLDVVASGVRYRVFLLASSLQLDVSFWPEDEFRATETGFTLLFGQPQPATRPPELDVPTAIGMSWLYALRARSAMARGRTWQAVMMLNHLRDQFVSLACLRHRLERHHGREADLLPVVELTSLGRARASSLTDLELVRSLGALLKLLSAEVENHDADLAARLTQPPSLVARPVIS